MDLPGNSVSALRAPEGTVYSWFRSALVKLTLRVFDYIHTRPVSREITILGRRFVVYPGVYNPHFSNWINFPSSEHLARHLSVRPEDQVLDVGTGIGVQAVFAALTARRVIATDINPAAVLCAAENARINGVAEVVEVRLGDTFEPVGNERFDLVIWLPPSFFVDPTKSYQSGWMCGAHGEVLDRFCRQVSDHLNPGGRLQFSCVGRNRPLILSRLAERGFQCRLSAPPLRRFPLETVTLYEARLLEKGTAVPSGARSEWEEDVQQHVSIRSS